MSDIRECLKRQKTHLTEKVKDKEYRSYDDIYKLLSKYDHKLLPHFADRWNRMPEGRNAKLLVQKLEQHIAFWDKQDKKVADEMRLAVLNIKDSAGLRESIDTEGEPIQEAADMSSAEKSTVADYQKRTVQDRAFQRYMQDVLNAAKEQQKAMKAVAKAKTFQEVRIALIDLNNYTARVAAACEYAEPVLDDIIQEMFSLRHVFRG